VPWEASPQAKILLLAQSQTFWLPHKILGWLRHWRSYALFRPLARCWTGGACATRASARRNRAKAKRIRTGAGGQQWVPSASAARLLATLPSRPTSWLLDKGRDDDDISIKLKHRPFLTATISSTPWPSSRKQAGRQMLDYFKQFFKLDNQLPVTFCHFVAEPIFQSVYWFAGYLKKKWIKYCV